MSQARNRAEQRKSGEAPSISPLPVPDAEQFPRCVRAMGFINELDQVFEHNLARFLNNTALAEATHKRKVSD